MFKDKFNFGRSQIAHGRLPNLFWLIALLLSLSVVSIGCLGAPAYEYKGAGLEPPAPLPDFE
jgi:hypothetical protein